MVTLFYSIQNAVLKTLNILVEWGCLYFNINFNER